MIKEELISEQNAFPRGGYVFALLPTGFCKSEESKSVFALESVRLEHLNTVRPFLYLDLTCRSAKARYINC